MDIRVVRVLLGHEPPVDHCALDADLCRSACVRAEEVEARGRRPAVYEHAYLRQGTTGTNAPLVEGYGRGSARLARRSRTCSSSRGVHQRPERVADGYGYADDLLRLNFPDEYLGADQLSVRGYVKQIGQIPAPVAQGGGYTLLPRSGVEAFVNTARIWA